ncbi:MAG: ribbon-helix-helix domain-containing protein [Pseudomonadota bacterium]
MSLQKRSVTLQGHRTSISLEAEFWETLKGIAKTDGQSLNALVSEVDATRDVTGKTPQNLSSALRVYVLNRLKNGGVSKDQ